MLWVTRRPAAGKSVLGCYAIGQLQKTNTDCSYFFFRHGDKFKSRLSAYLRSLAFQMTCTNDQVREALLEMQKYGMNFENRGERTRWRRLLSCIFQTKFPRYYWVLDGLDECMDFGSLLDSMLAKLGEFLPLRILITSRETRELEKHFSNLGAQRVQCKMISTANTLSDIKLLVETKAKSVLLKDDKDRAALVEKILENPKALPCGRS